MQFVKLISVNVVKGRFSEEYLKVSPITGLFNTVNVLISVSQSCGSGWGGCSLVRGELSVLIRELVGR